ncbi:MAG: hypothetical protein COT74_11735 [Bdellovibrionales bacterium CG10_big_fil_rev_8_21_14_0_10_45_34]|nr:MAG: hypothetical protein COT74_11735 [Bdellovibrionales bacterium CG10_big_fil_rev_8_21_14_0_10_45_34]
MIRIEVLNFSFYVICAGILLAFYRMYKGPSLPDRVLAADVISTGVSLLAVLYCLFSHTDYYLDAAIAIALMGFLGTIGFSRFMERKAHVHD